jgi:histidinol-phosphate aminotransferase
MPRSLRKAWPTVAAFSAMERLDGHGRSVSIRVSQPVPHERGRRPGRLALAHVGGLHAYTPGLQPTEPGWTKLNTNECPYPPSPRVAEAIVREVGPDGANLRLYPNPTSAPASLGGGADARPRHRQRLHRERLGRHPESPRPVLLRPGAAAGFTLPGYSLYPVLIGIQGGAAATPIELDRSMRLPVERIAASGARIFFLTSPNAPTGVGFPNSDIAGSWNPSRASSWSTRPTPLRPREHGGPRRQASRTSWSYPDALEGLRARGHPRGVRPGRRRGHRRHRPGPRQLQREPAVAGGGAGGAGDPDYTSASWTRSKSTRDFYAHSWTAERGWFTFPSQANFICDRAQRQPRPHRALRREGGAGLPVLAKVLVRHFPSDALTASFLRISVGTDDEMLVLDETLDAWLKAPPSA